MAPTDVTAALLKIAGEAVQTARKNGGNQHRIVYLQELPETATPE